MKVWLDDIREAPEGWTRCYWPDEVIALINAGGVDEISLDHDLGDCPQSYFEQERTGYQVLLALEVMQHENPSLILPVIHVHSANPVAAKRMKEVVKLLQSRSKR
jgi:hypothetical protein